MLKYLALILMTITLYSCNSISGNGHIVNEKRNLNRFDGVQTTGSIDVEISGGDKPSVEVEADNNVLPYIITKSDNGLLDVYFEPGTSFNNVHAKVYVTLPAVKKIFIRGSGNITSTNNLKSTGTIETDISGSGDIHANLDAPGVKATISGSGNIVLLGRCKDFEGSISGSGDLKCHDLLSENANVSIAGSGSAHVFASVHLTASVNGSGDIYYSGNPSSPQIDKSGSGNVIAEK